MGRFGKANINNLNRDFQSHFIFGNFWILVQALGLARANYGFAQNPFGQVKSKHDINSI